MRIPLLLLLLLLLALLLPAGAVFVHVGAAAAGWARAGTPRVRLCVVGTEVVRPASCWACFSVWLNSCVMGAAARLARGAAVDWAGARGSGENSGVPNSSLEEFGLLGLFK